MTRAPNDLPADDRLEMRLPHRLKQDAEAMARAKGQTLSQWVLVALAEKITAEYTAAMTWELPPDATAELLKVLVAPVATTPALADAHVRAVQAFGPEMP